jgi:ribosomal protein L29
MADGSTKAEEIRRKVARLKGQLSDCCSKENTDMKSLEQEFGKLKKEIREHRIQKAAMPWKRLRHEQ